MRSLQCGETRERVGRACADGAGGLCFGGNGRGTKCASLLFRMRNELKAHLEKEGIML